MTGPLRILGIGGSVRANSVNRYVLNIMLETAKSLGAETVLADVHTLNLPIFNQYLPLDDQPKKIFWLIEQMQWADGFIICSPTYLGSLSGAVKNVLDSLHLAHDEPRVYFEQRPVALASFGAHGTANTIASLQFVTKVMGATIVPDHLTITPNKAHERPDFAADPVLQQRMIATVSRLLEMAQAHRDGK